MTEHETPIRYTQDEVTYFSTDGRHRVLSTILKEMDAFPKMPMKDKQVIITVDGEVYTLPDQLKVSNVGTSACQHKRGAEIMKTPVTREELTWYPVNGHSVCILPEEASDDTILRALTRPAYDEDFVGPHQPLMRGEIGEILGVRVVRTSFPWVPPVKAKPKKKPPQSKGPTKHWRRW